MPYVNDGISLNEAKDLLRTWRENNERKSEDITEIAVDVLISNINKLGSEKHLILEQIIYASLDTHSYQLCSYCINLLKEEFPQSLRVLKYQACLQEAQEKYDDALRTLDTIVTLDQTNAAARKRRVALMKAQGNRHDATYALAHEYLRLFSSDVEAWEMLCGMYLEVGEYPKAAFCAEELILHQPHNHHHHQRLADIRYTMSGVENIELAKLYYCQALKLNPKNMRALLGLVLVTNNLLGCYKTSGNSSKRKEIWKLSQWAASRVTSVHKEAAVGNLSQALMTLSITE